MRYKTARLLKQTSMYKSRYVYNRHYLPSALCPFYPLQLMPGSLLQQGTITPCIFFSNIKSGKNSARDFSRRKILFFFFLLQMEPSRLQGKVLNNLRRHIYLMQEQKWICPKTPPDKERDVSVESTTAGKRV